MQIRRDRAKVVCICGSTKFLDEEREAYFRETYDGNIVLSHSGRRVKDKSTGGFLDRLHLQKIELADEILVLNVDGYIGDSTKNEIRYAKSFKNKVIRYWTDEIKEDWYAKVRQRV